jgi:AraC-like DNA-binding protein
VILHQAGFDAEIRRRLASPPAPLDQVAEHYWGFTWDRNTAFPSSLIPGYSINLTREQGSGRPGSEAPAVLTGVPTERFDVMLQGEGSVLGVKFHPGGFTALTGARAADLTDRTVDATEFLPQDVADAFVRAADAPPEQQVDAVTAALLPLLDPVTAIEGAPSASSTRYRQAREIFARTEDPEVVSTAALAERTGLGVRTLQRLFDQWIGLPPTQVITRMRLQDAAAALDADPSTLLADLAVRLGFYDQAHFTREFARFVGEPPAAYAARSRPPRPLQSPSDPVTPPPRVSHLGD